MAQQILRVPQVSGRVGLSRSMIYELVSRGDFPKPIKLGSRSVGWLAEEIDTWISKRAELRQAA